MVLATFITELHYLHSKLEGNLLDPDDVVGVLVAGPPVLRPVAAEPPPVAVVELAAELLLQLEVLPVDRGRRPVPAARRMKEAHLRAIVKIQRSKRHQMYQKVSRAHTHGNKRLEVLTGRPQSRLLAEDVAQGALALLVQEVPLAALQALMGQVGHLRREE